MATCAELVEVRMFFASLFLKNADVMLDLFHYLILRFFCF